MENIGRVTTIVRVVTFTLLAAVSATLMLLGVTSSTALAQGRDPAQCGEGNGKECHLGIKHWDNLDKRLKTLEKAQSAAEAARRAEETARHAEETARRTAGDVEPLLRPPSTPAFAGWSWGVLGRGGVATFAASDELAGLVVADIQLRWVSATHWGAELAFLLGISPMQDESVKADHIAPFVVGGRAAILAAWDMVGLSAGPELLWLQGVEEDEGGLLLSTLPFGLDLRTPGGGICGRLAIAPTLFSEDSRLSGLWLMAGLGYCGAIPE